MNLPVKFKISNPYREESLFIINNGTQSVDI